MQINGIQVYKTSKLTFSYKAKQNIRTQDHTHTHIGLHAHAMPKDSTCTCPHSLMAENDWRMGVCGGGRTSLKARARRAVIKIKRERF